MTKELKERFEEIADKHHFKNRPVIIAMLEEAYAIDRNEWVSVDERLTKVPEEWYLVLVKNKNKEGGIYLTDIAIFDSDGQWQKSNTWEKVTHWMPLPKTPLTTP